MTTLLLLLARHDGQEEIPFPQMAREYFRLEPEALERKIKNGVIKFEFLTDQKKPIRTSKVPLSRLAHYIQQRRAAAMVRMEEYLSE
ncbi:pyocin activator PrtN family protein [uncultured Ruegeria sp.]|uniref:pyocin activator PrtN family protein n=1 Tax=uncultured Ruegeria sp. TaxID=259304 RepID=UPI002609C417|nr:pyocin activator PrtN family protein [uncultured Ruegeria sp.]